MTTEAPPDASDEKPSGRRQRRQRMHVRPVFNRFGEPCWLVPDDGEDSKLTLEISKRILLSNRRRLAEAKCWEIDHDAEPEMITAIEQACRRPTCKCAAQEKPCNRCTNCWCGHCIHGHNCSKWADLFGDSASLVEYIDRDPDVVVWPYDEPENVLPPEGKRFLFGLFSEEELIAAASHTFAFFERMFANAGMPFNPAGSTEMPMSEALSVLGLSWPCTKEQLTTAYRAKAFAAHPDRGGTEEQIVKVNAARETIAKALGTKP